MIAGWEKLIVPVLQPLIFQGDILRFYLLKFYFHYDKKIKKIIH